MRKVSVHIVTFNSSAYIRNCLNAVLQQNYPIDQIIVIDNNSHDETLSILAEFKNNIHLIVNKENVGFAPAHNQAFRLTESEYSLVLNPDVTLHPDYVLNLLKFVEDNLDKKIGSMTGKLLLSQSPDRIDSTGLKMTKARRAFDRGAGQSADVWTKQDEVFGVSGAAALYLRQMIEDVSIEGSFFDDDFFAYKEDVDVAWRAQIMGWTAYFCPDAIAYHERGWKKESRHQIPVIIRRYSYINRYKMIVKNDHWLYILRDFPFILAYEIQSLVYFIIKEPSVLGAWGSFWRSLSRLLYKRRLIQSKKKSNNRRLFTFFE
ncbi:glycosyltransferase family 2 protein [Paenibacillus filicis]|uniref:Glycosyltransferase family 2 protein n=1 Tax=Paenibacillus gyeongsangnamensis TaxID=3388067 RepID=A0ABT4Q6P5_9BACL|nr:glycosyltransferase family 2 protein [Paenibacillus filicis]MCZ8512546.1 glycosyltransferase family 2 protein [Paenibacillus filicis]